LRKDNFYKGRSKRIFFYSIKEDKWLAVISIEIFEKLKTHEMMTS